MLVLKKKPCLLWKQLPILALQSYLEFSQYQTADRNQFYLWKVASLSDTMIVAI